MFGSVHRQTEILTRPATEAATLAVRDRTCERQSPVWSLIPRNIFEIVAQGKTRDAQAILNPFFSATHKCYWRVKVFNSSVENFVEKTSGPFENPQDY
jgi:hypothetical protein